MDTQYGRGARGPARRDASRRVVVYLGDYVDRGPNSRTVLEHLLTQPLADCESVHLAGNHDRWMLKFLDDASVGSPWLPIFIFFSGASKSAKSSTIFLKRERSMNPLFKPTAFMPFVSAWKQKLHR